jgi:16S rRNA (cytidine1402-2'-O)-methyltransferase
VANGTLYLVGTPIGNLADLSDRARQTLAAADVIAAEDTRRAGRLLKGIGVRARMMSLFDANERERVPALIDALRSGLDVAVVSDAGMPGVSDPGFRLVRACAAAGIRVTVVPGPSAVLAALVVSGLPTDRFAFEGFLPRKPAERRARLLGLASERRTLVAFESPHRVLAALREALDVLGDREAALVREVTKRHEEVVRGRISEILERIGDGPVRGEIVLVLQGADAARPPSPESLVAVVRARVDAGARPRDAARDIAAATGVSANELYRTLMSERANGGEPSAR